MNKKLHAEYVEKMKMCIENGDIEMAHSDADELLCEFLRKLGYDELVEKYLKVYKWYA